MSTSKMVLNVPRLLQPSVQHVKHCRFCSAKLCASCRASISPGPVGSPPQSATTSETQEEEKARLMREVAELRTFRALYYEQLERSAQEAERDTQVNILPPSLNSTTAIKPIPTTSATPARAAFPKENSSLWVCSTTHPPLAVCLPCLICCAASLLPSLWLHDLQAAQPSKPRKFRPLKTIRKLTAKFTPSSLAQ